MKDRKREREWGRGGVSEYNWTWKHSLWRLNTGCQIKQKMICVCNWRTADKREKNVQRGVCECVCAVRVTLAVECEFKKQKKPFERVLISWHSVSPKPFWWKNSLWLRIQLSEPYKPFLCVYCHVSFLEYWIASSPPCAFNKECCANNLNQIILGTRLGEKCSNERNKPDPAASNLLIFAPCLSSSLLLRSFIPSHPFVLLSTLSSAPKSHFILFCFFLFLSPVRSHTDLDALMKHVSPTRSDVLQNPCKH